MRQRQCKKTKFYFAAGNIIQLERLALRKFSQLSSIPFGFRLFHHITLDKSTIHTTASRFVSWFQAR